ncbi:MAG: S-layer homology domain-containing protein, partial [Bacillota bacterium]|nr:S-layer homology domain-containing protein [Bacillota bacterium]
MKNLKKVLALVVAYAMFFTMSSFSSYAFSDVKEDASYLEAVTMLTKLGIINGYEDGTFLPDNTITRAEVAKVLVCALGNADQAAGMTGNNTFTDVPSTHWAAGYINYCASFGIINGVGNGKFDPDSPVTYEQIAKMIVAMLGYTPVANVKGGYPTGYLYVANSMVKITKGATGETGQPAKRWVVARLVFNALDAPIMEQSSWKASDPDFTQGDKTLLKDYLEVTKVEGVVTNTFYQDTTLDDKDNKDIDIKVSSIDGYTSDSKLEDEGYNYSTGIDDTYTVDAKTTGAEEYLGYTVVAYVSNFDEGDDELVAIAPKSNKNSTLEVNFQDFEETTDTTGAEYSTPSISFEYYAKEDDTEPTTAKIYNKSNDEAAYYVN